MARRQLPVYSPVSWRALVAAVPALIRGDPEGAIEARVLRFLASRFDSRDVLLTDSGTSALRLTIECAADGGRPVALPAYCCYDVATAAIGARVPVVLYDIDPTTLGPDLGSIESLRSEDPFAVVVVHPFGLPANVLDVRNVLPDCLMIEDAAQGAGGRLAGRILGSLGSVSVLSFGRGKGMTGGGGGAVLALDDRGLGVVAAARRLMQKLRYRRGAGEFVTLLAQFTLGRPSLYSLPTALPFLHLGETVYRQPRPPERAAFGSLKMLEALVPASDREVHVRKQNAQRLTASVGAGPRVHGITLIPNADPGYLRLPVRLVEGGAETVTTPLARLGIARMYPTTLADLPAVRDQIPRRNGGSLEGAREVQRSLITLPTHSRLTERDLATIEMWLHGGV